VKHGLLAFLLVLGCPGYGVPRTAGGSASPVSKSNRDWVITWDDEFDGQRGSSPDKSHWVAETGGNSWGNQELQYYTPRRENLRQQDGHLVMEAAKEEFTGSDGVKRHYTSARIMTQGRFSQTYGRFEARIKIPFGQGMWPAFWLLGDDFSKVGWPACGEIDIMENSGAQRSTIHSSLHGPGYADTEAITSSYTLPKGGFSDDFHVFAVEWAPEVIRFYVDDQLYGTRTPADLPKGSRWVFDHPFFLVLNLAVGGNFPGRPDSSTVFPQRMLVDYVRVYSRGKVSIDTARGANLTYSAGGRLTESRDLPSALYLSFTARSVLAFLRKN
jgi:beta-glucanase (GH16 family)